MTVFGLFLLAVGFVGIGYTRMTTPLNRPPALRSPVAMLFFGLVGLIGVILAIVGL